MFSRYTGRPASPTRGALAILLVATGLTLQAGPPGNPGRRDASTEAPLLVAVRENLRNERALLVEYAYRERRQPVHVSKLGKVSVGDEQVFEVYPTGDPDRPRRVLVEVGGRPATAAQRVEYARKHPGEAPADAARHAAERRQRAQERFDDAFRLFGFEFAGVEVIDGRPVRKVTVTPRPGVQTRSDLGKWMKKFGGVAWVDEAAAELLRLELTATDAISLGWGVVGRIAAGTRLTYVRAPAAGGRWLPAMARFEAQGRTLLFRSFQIDTRTEWFDYRPHTTPAGPDAAARDERPREPLR